MSASLTQRRQPAGDPLSEIQPVDEPDAQANLHAKLGKVTPKPKLFPCRASAAAAALTALAILAAVRLLPPALRGGGPGGAAVPGDSLLTAEQLARFDGRQSRRVCLAVLGAVYDVTAGARHYGPGGGYAFFSGRDASRSFVTGRFAADLHDDVAGLSGAQMRELVRWRDFYDRHKEYRRVGRVVGRFYDARGTPTPLLAEVEAAAAAAAAAEEAAAAAEASARQAGTDFPCNVNWSRAEGGRVWCPEGSVPRRVMRPGWDGQPEERCACMSSTEVSGAARLYDGCAPEAARCATSPPEAPDGGDAAVA